MRIAIWQVAYDESGGWYHERLPELLSAAAACAPDLVVFPECFPFWAGRERAPTAARAERLLRRHGRGDLPAFIAGGYVFDRDSLRNRIFLVHGGEVLGHYDKRWPWAGEGTAGHEAEIEPGRALTLFSWRHGACVPLICADVLSPSETERAALQAEARSLGAGPEVPLVVCAYAARTRGRRWTARLREWSRACRAPLAFCNFAGVDREGFGRGGSGAFWPDGRHSPRPRKPGVFTFEMTSP